MAIIPMKQTITLTRDAVKDAWGRIVTPGVTLNLKCRVSESSSVVQNQLGKEVVAGMKIILDKLTEIRYDDKIDYTNELNQTISRSPIRIEVVRDIGGKSILTVVYV